MKVTIRSGFVIDRMYSSVTEFTTFHIFLQYLYDLNHRFAYILDTEFYILVWLYLLVISSSRRSCCNDPVKFFTSVRSIPSNIKGNL